MNKIREKIKNNLDALEDAMRDQRHLEEDGIVAVLILIAACSKYWRVLTDDDRDWLNAVRYAVEEQKRWE